MYATENYHLQYVVYALQIIVLNTTPPRRAHLLNVPYGEKTCQIVKWNECRLRARCVMYSCLDVAAGMLRRIVTYWRLGCLVPKMTYGAVKLCNE